MWKVLENWVNRYFADEEAVLLTVLMVLAFLVLIILGRVLAPFFAAVVIAFLLQGGVNRLVRWHIPYGLSVWLVFTGFIGLVLLAMVFLVPMLVKQSTNLVSQIPRMVRKLQDALVELPERYPQLVSEQAVRELYTYASNESMRMAETMLAFSFGSLPNIIAIIVYLVLVPFMVFFMLKDKQTLLGGITGFLPHNRPVMRRIWVEMNQQMANYVRGKAIEILIVGVVSYVAFVALGLDYAVLLALLVGVSVVIPYIGAAVVTVPVLLVGYFQWGWGDQFIWLAVVYLVIQFMDGNVLVPVLFSEVVDLHPVVIILAILVFGGLWGFWGIFFAIPLATLFKAMYLAWPRLEQSPDEPEPPGQLPTP